MRVRTHSLGWGALLAASSMVLGQANLEKGTLTVTVEGLIPKTGVLRAALYPSSDGFPGITKKAFLLRRMPVTESRQSITFEDIPFGSYALSVYQDLNNDQRLNKSFLGIPKEPVGFSNDPPLRNGPPSFEDAVFLFNHPLKTATIHIRAR